MRTPGAFALRDPTLADMGRSYRYVVRLGEPLSSEIQDLVRDVADRFGVRAALRNQPSPQFRLYGPYQARNPDQAAATARAVLDQYDVVPFRVEGFDHFRTETIHANVVPSPRLRALRTDLERGLDDVSRNGEMIDDSRSDGFSISIASDDIGRQFDDIWEYVIENWQLDREAYASRVTAYEDSRMLWEWDLPRGMELDPHRATNTNTWAKTNDVLEAKATESDHDFERGVDDPGPLERSADRIRDFIWPS